MHMLANDATYAPDEYHESNEQRRYNSTNTVKPHIQHATSLLSSSAGYLSDYASDASSARSTTNGYSTPPSRVSTPLQFIQQQEQHRSPVTLPPSVTAMPSPLNIRGNVPGQAATRTVSNTNRTDTITPGVDDTPYIRFAVEQLTFDEELMGRGRHSSDFNSPYIPAQPVQPQQTRDTTQHQRRTSQPPQRPFQFPRASSEDSRQPRLGETMLLAADPPSDRHQLGFVPTPLRPLPLGLLIFLCIWIIIALIAGNIYALTNHGLYDYNGYTTATYFVFEYLPPLLGILLIIWLFTIQSAMYRVLPYMAMSRPHPSDRHAVYLQRMPVIPANFVLPDWRFFERGEPQIGLVLLVFWLMNWTVPLLSCLYGTQFFTNVGRPRFRWTPVQGLGWFIMVMYMLLIVALVYLLVRFRKKKSNLMWDPTCLADLIILFQRSNVLQDYMRSETKEDLPDDLPARYSRLGYWTTNQSPDVFYAVGESNQPVIPLSTIGTPQTVEKNVIRTSGDSEADRLVSQLRDSHTSSFSKTIHSPFVRFRWCAWFLQDSAILAWTIAALLLLIGFLVVSFVNSAVQNGWNPLLGSTTQSNGFSPANFLYSFIPALLGMFLFLAWQPIDTYYRALQPYANLSQPDGATARRSILQSYNAMPLGIVTFAALRNRDLKLAYITLISLLSATIPVLAGAVFTASLFPGNHVRMLASMPGYYALCVFLSIYAVSFLMVWPTRKRYLPHPVDTVAGNLSFLYASRLMRDSSIRNIRTKADFVDRLETDSNSGLTGYGQTRRERSEKHPRGPPRYGFGVFTGVDGQEHLGIDRMTRSGNVDTLITTGAFHNHNERM